MKLIKWCAAKLWSLKFYILFLGMATALVYMFNQNYQFQALVVSKKAETYQTVFNERAACLTELEVKKQAVLDSNADIFEPLTIN